MSIRILGGSYRGRVLASVPGQATRPLLGQAKQALFNILATEIQGAKVWDLFAGTGATGIEALSRGAAKVLFVERAPKALQVLKANLVLLDLEEGDQCRIHRGNAWEPQAKEEKPDLIFLDPPYEQVRRDPLGSLTHARALLARLAPGGRLIFHFPKSVLNEKSLSDLGELDLRHFGGATLALLR
jgi:16S rRNA (guanine966-N2)-methyltransferase